MRNSRRKKDKVIIVTDLYAFKFGAYWAALKKEHLSLWMLCGYFFFEYVRPQALYPALDVIPWGLLFLAGALVFAFLDKTARLVSNVQNFWFLTFTLVLILSSIFAFRPAVSLDYWTVFGTWFIMYFLVTSIVNTETRLLLFIVAYCLFNFKMSQHGAVTWAQRGFSFASYGLNGAPGWFRNSGEYAIQMLIFGSLAISIVLALKGHWGKHKKIIFFALAATGYMSVMGASSRGAQIALAVIGVWLLLKQENGFKGLLAMVVIAVVLFNILPDAQMQRFREMGNDVNSLQRLSYWKFGIDEVIPRFPVLGVGYHNWFSYLMYVSPEGMGPMQKNQESHNIYIQATSELGFVGLFCFLMLILLAFKNNSRTRKIAIELDNRFMYFVAYGYDAGLIGYLVAGSFVTVLYYPFFWVQIAMIVSLNNVANIKMGELTKVVKKNRFSMKG